ncbi:NAD(P)/FAD-dependent oxidoreductase [Gallibacterium anatis]|uniref:Membrane protein n=1 Tax=Gallibacterium anatis TaxID=750 RepID=A0A1A7P830_9PAST|nr:NAD(P)/FAD-dependent oxidoreductase [Gallibacterium anatis]KGQ54334.1 membrane protein [Gallibacterium anatis DSM 16844 = F 149]OBW95041.1 membrane protein [Gallibacterium anatis]OBW97866.1 membrane protein [Gallibacterium anatis]STO38356.1 putative FAD-binding dehydrogenase [Gallibacterium anatis]
MKRYDVIIIGAGAAGLFCAAQIGKKGRSVLLLDNGKKVGRKILMSGGGYCNFTNLDVGAQHYLSQNPHFVKSALARYNQWDFIALLAAYGISYHEKELGQLFTDNGAEQIVAMLLKECQAANVQIQLQVQISQVTQLTDGFEVKYGNELCLQCENLVIASGGLSMPKLGATAFGYQIAEQFGLSIVPPRASLVPFTWREQDQVFADLAGISLPITVTAENGMSFSNALLFTHRGISGPAMLQISNYWLPNQPLFIDFLPKIRLDEYLQAMRQSSSKMQLKTALQRLLPNKLVEFFISHYQLPTTILADLSNLKIAEISQLFHQWQFVPNGTEGYRTAEVTLGGVDTNQISSKTMEVKNVKGLYFIGEVLDVTGWLGGYNFQWAWSSAYACATAIDGE